MDTLSYDGLRVIVSGGGGAGIGAAAVDLLTRLGAEVHVFDLKEPSSRVASFTPTNLLDPDEVGMSVEGVGGPVNALFNCAGLPGPPFPDLDTMLVNFGAPRHLTSLVVPLMPPGSAIVSVCSTAAVEWRARYDTWIELIGTEGFDGARNWCEAHPEEIAGGYSPSKQALLAWTHFVSYDLIAKGIRINATSPGPTATPMMSLWENQLGTEFFTSMTAFVGRSATPVEQASPLVFLNHPVASYINGINLITDAGMLAGTHLGRMGSEPAEIGRRSQHQMKPT